CDLALPLAAAPVISTLSLHDALPISPGGSRGTFSTPTSAITPTASTSAARLIASSPHSRHANTAGRGHGRSRGAETRSVTTRTRSEEHTSELQSRENLVWRRLP